MKIAPGGNFLYFIKKMSELNKFSRIRYIFIFVLFLSSCEQAVEVTHKPFTGKNRFAIPKFHHSESDYYLPIGTANRQSVEEIELTAIGAFGVVRKARPHIPAHLHTGVDLKRPSDNYMNEPVYPCAEGRVISIREEGPFSQIIIEHTDGAVFWSVYEHAVEIDVALNDVVGPCDRIARFMNTDELDRYGWHFDHLHFEILKVSPPLIGIDAKNPYRRFGTYSLCCYGTETLHGFYYNPISFLQKEFENLEGR